LAQAREAGFLERLMSGTKWLARLNVVVGSAAAGVATATFLPGESVLWTMIPVAGGTAIAVEASRQQKGLGVVRRGAARDAQSLSQSLERPEPDPRAGLEALTRFGAAHGANNESATSLFGFRPQVGSDRQLVWDRGFALLCQQFEGWNDWYENPNFTMQLGSVANLLRRDDGNNAEAANEIHAFAKEILREATGYFVERSDVDGVETLGWSRSEGAYLTARPTTRLDSGGERLLPEIYGGLPNEVRAWFGEYEGETDPVRELPSRSVEPPAPTPGRGLDMGLV